MKQEFNMRVLRLTSADTRDQIKQISARSKMDNQTVNDKVADILFRVKTQGDSAVLAYTKQFDHVDLQPEQLFVSPEEMEEAQKLVPDRLRMDLEQAARSIRAFHEAQLINTQEVCLQDSMGSSVKLIERPLNRVGIYVPGGTAPLPSSVLMNAIPASVAGVEELIMVTPPNPAGKIAPVILEAARIAGVTKIYKVGGAQAISALAYGTQTIPQVDKITGPGNIYVNAAKRQVYGTVDIDMFAGPSEIMILADATANPEFIARDILSQAEHDVLASAILVTTSEDLGQTVAQLVSDYAAKAGRRDILAQSLPSYGAILLCPTLDQAVTVANQFAPEHLEIMVDENQEDRIVKQIRNAGAVFVGPYSPEPLGDYFAGPNHVLPTSGTARFFSPLNVSQFRKKISLIHYRKESLLAVADPIIRLAQAESLDCHAAAVACRQKEEACPVLPID